MKIKLSKNKMLGLLEELKSRQGTKYDLDILDRFEIEAEIVPETASEAVWVKSIESVAFQKGYDAGYREGYHDGKNRRGYCNRDDLGRHVHCIHYC